MSFAARTNSVAKPCANDCTATLVAPFFASSPACTVAMESCSGSQHWARKLQELGHQGMLIPAQHVVAYRRGAKNDRNDTAAIAEAAARTNVRPIPVKSTDQTDIQTSQRVRESVVQHRTALINELRGLLFEYGVVCAKGVTRFLVWLREEFAAQIALMSPLAQKIFRRVPRARRTTGSLTLTSESKLFSTQIQPANGSPRFRASEYLPRPRSSPRFSSHSDSRTAGNLPLTSNLCRDST